MEGAFRITPPQAPRSGFRRKSFRRNALSDMDDTLLQELTGTGEQCPHEVYFGSRRDLDRDFGQMLRNSQCVTPESDPYAEIMLSESCHMESQMSA